MNTTRLKCFFVIGGLAILGFGPLSLTCLIGMYVLVSRPPWFLGVVRGVYTDSGVPLFPRPRLPSPGASATRFRCFLSLLTLLLLDIAPVPVTGSIALVIVLVRPQWFYELAERIYSR